MNCFSRSDFGAPNTCSGGPSSSTQPVVQVDHVARDLAGELHLVGDQDHGAAFARQVADHLQHLADQFGVERRGRFVEQHDTRLDRQRPGDRAALLLAARQEGRIDVALFGEPDAGKQPLGLDDRLASPPSEHMDRHLDDVLDQRHVAPKVEALEHHAEPRADPFDLAAVGRHGMAVAVGLEANLLAIDADQCRSSGFPSN